VARDVAPGGALSAPVAATSSYLPGLLVRLSDVPADVSFRHLRDVAQMPGRPRYVDCPPVYNNGVVDARPLSAASRAGVVPDGLPSTARGEPAGSAVSGQGAGRGGAAAGLVTAIVRYFTPAEAAHAVAYFAGTPVLLAGQRVTAEAVGGDEEVAYWRGVVAEKEAFQRRKTGSDAAASSSGGGRT
jgi:hypothetical protein